MNDEQPILRIPATVANAISEAIDFLLQEDIDRDTAANDIAQAILDSRKAIESVEMRPAYNWTCPECGRDGFVRSIAHPITPEDCEEMELDPEDAESANWQTYPRTVTCEHCDSKFETIGFPNDED